MSHPQNSDSYHNLQNMAISEDLLYLLSLKYTDGISEKSNTRISQ